MANYNYGADYEVVGRIMEGTKVCGYMVRNRRKKVKVLTKEVFEQLALMKQIYNCNAQEYEGKVNLRGVEIKLVDLPKFRLNGERIK